MREMDSDKLSVIKVEDEKTKVEAPLRISTGFQSPTVSSSAVVAVAAAATREKNQDETQLAVREGADLESGEQPAEGSLRSHGDSSYVEAGSVENLPLATLANTTATDTPLPTAFSFDLTLSHYDASTDTYRLMAPATVGFHQSDPTCLAFHSVVDGTRLLEVSLLDDVTISRRSMWKIGLETVDDGLYIIEGRPIDLCTMFDVIKDRMSRGRGQSTACLDSAGPAPAAAAVTAATDSQNGDRSTGEPTVEELCAGASSTSGVEPESGLTKRSTSSNLSTPSHVPSPSAKHSRLDEGLDDDRYFYSSDELTDSDDIDEDGGCPICGEEFSYLPDLVEHLAADHQADESDLSCPICGEEFDYESQLCEHVAKHVYD